MKRDAIQAWRRGRRLSGAGQRRSRPALEVLENRRLLAITVNTLDDNFDPNNNDGTISLRDAIAESPAGGTIDFSVTGTINLDMGPVEVSDRIIDGPGAASLTIQAPHGSGSSVFITSGTTTLSGMTITGGDAQFGGGIRNESVNGNVASDLTVVDSVITGNVARSGGGIYVGGYIGVYNRVTVLNSTISDNQSLNPGFFPSYHYGRGGGIDSYFAYLTVDKSTISGNFATGHGGGIYAGNLTMTNSTVTGNSSGGYTGQGDSSNRLGDALYVFAGTIANSTISGNLQGSGIRGGNVVVDNSTITNNFIGVYSVGGTVTLLNSIVVGNTEDDIAGTVDTAASRNNLIGTPTNTYNLKGLGPPAGGLIDGVNGNIVGDLDPGVGPLADNGGPTETCALDNFSPAINAGDNSLVPIDPSTGLPYATDQTGAPRIFDGGTVDMGAVEVQATIVPSTVVDTTTDDEAADGQTSLRAVIGWAARLGDTVTFDPTVFDTPQTIALVLGPITVDGTFVPVTITGPGADLTTVDGGGAPAVFVTYGTTTISGLTLTGAGQEIIPPNGLQPSTTISVGAIDNESGTLTVQDCTITGNEARGILNQSTLTVVSSTISGNQGFGGCGIKSYNKYVAPTAMISNSIIDGNKIIDDPLHEYAAQASGGGGIYFNGTMTISNSTISNNSSTQKGGGIFVGAHGTATVVNSIISGNSADSEGGGIYAHFFGTATVINSIISGNSAGSEGGGIYSNYDPGAGIPGLYVFDSTISGNSGGVLGGGILGNGATVINSTISGNSAVVGGGIWGGFAATIRNSTIANNTASLVGGGLYDQGSTVFNSIIAGNLGGGQPSDVHSLDLFKAASAYNLIGDAGSAGGLVNGVNGNVVGVDPLLGPLADNGGPTQTMALLAGSPAIDKGDNTLVPFTTDQRGFTSVVNGTVDIGAFEDQVVVTTPTNPQTAIVGSAATVNLGSFADSAINPGNSTVVVDFGDGSPTMTLLNVAPGSLGSVTHTFTSPGTNTVTVTVTDQFGDANLGTLGVVVATPTATAISVSASSAAAAFGQPETFTATVTTPSGDPIPTSSDGMVTFYDGTTALGSATLAGSPATATLTIPAGLAVGSHTITASYSGDVDFRPASSGVESTSAQLVVPAIGLNDPTGVAVDRNGDVFIADFGNNQVVEVKADGTHTTVGSGLNGPTGVAVDGNGDVFISDSANNRVVEVKEDGTQTTVGSGLSFPEGLAVDSSGDVFIADFGNNQVVEVKADGTQTTVGSGLSDPTGVAVDGNGDVFIADFGNNQVVEVKADGTQTTVGSGLNTPFGVAVDTQGDVFIADFGNNRVVELKADGSETTVGSGLNSPSGVAVDGNGDAFIADTLNNRVVEVTAGVPVTVVPATPTVSVTPVNITYGTALSNTQLSGTATWTVGGSPVTVAGTFTYTTAAGNVLGAGTGQSEAVTFTPSDSTDYTTASTTVTVNVAQATPTVSVNPVNINYGKALSNSQLSGTATWTVGGNPVTVTGTFTYTTAAGNVLGAGTGQSEAVTFTPSDSTDYTTASTTVIVNVAQAGTTTALSSSMNPTVYGQAVTFTATVASAVPLVGPPTGSVTFFAGATPLGSAPLSAGVASIAVTSLTIGSDQITAVYSGDTNFTGSPSTALSQTVTQDGTTTTVVSSANPSVFGQSVTFTATVSPKAPGSGTPTGTVIFMDGSTVLGSPILSGGVATYTTSSLSVSNHKVKVVYGGDSNFAGSVSSIVTQSVTKDATTTSVTSSANPSVFGQSVTFTATVAAAAPGSGTPTGTVTFKDGSSSLGTAALSGGSASLTTSSLGVATQSITVSFGGDASFTSSASATLNQVVNQANTTTSLVSATDHSVFGQAVTFTATVSASASGRGTPTGKVTFYDGSTSLGTASLSAGSASFTAKGLPTGGDPITASYAGSGNFTPSTSPILDQPVNQAATTSVVTSATNPSVFGQSVTFTATVTAVAPGSGTPTGSITFLDGSTTLGTATLSGGKATFKTTTLAAGPQTITVSYSGDGNFVTSTSGPLTQTVNQAGTTSKVTSSANPSVYGESVTFTATVKAVAPGSGTPTGTVRFLDGSTTLGTGTLSGGTATFSISTLAVAAHSITVFYEGDANFLTGTSGILTQTVKQATTTSSVSSSANPSVSGQAVTFTATIAPVSPGSGVPTGEVAFDDGSKVLGTVTLTNGIASFTTSSLAVGTHSIKAVYEGDTNFKASTSAVLKQVVNSSSNLVAAVTIAPNLVDQALSALGDETLTDALVSDLTALRTPVTRAKGASAALRR